MTEHHIEVVQALTMSLGESPLWSVERQTLYWVDINLGLIYVWQPSQTTPPTVIELDEKVGCIALYGNGLLAALASGLVYIELPYQGRFQRLADNPEWQDGAGNRFNDGRCDAAGRFWLGTIDAKEALPTAGLYCYHDGHLTQQIAGLTISNGLAFSPDGRWLYHTDSTTRRIQRYALNTVSGQLSESSTWVDLETWGLPGVPDGAAVDSQGDYWCALYNGGMVVRFSPAGELIGRYPVPCPHPTMVAFGGEDLRTLFVTTATQHLDHTGKQRYPCAGSLLAMRVDVPGIREPSCASCIP